MILLVSNVNMKMKFISSIYAVRCMFWTSVYESRYGKCIKTCNDATFNQINIGFWTFISFLCALVKVQLINNFFCVYDQVCLFLTAGHRTRGCDHYPAAKGTWTVYTQWQWLILYKQPLSDRGFVWFPVHVKASRRQRSSDK